MSSSTRLGGVAGQGACGAAESVVECDRGGERDKAARRVPVTVALRAQLAALTGGTLASSNITQFARTIGLVAVGAGAVALAAQLAFSRRQREAA